MLEEVIMYTFQQCVYYISKVRCHTGPARASPGLCRRVFFKLSLLGSCTTLRCFPSG